MVSLVAGRLLDAEASLIPEGLYWTRLVGIVYKDCLVSNKFVLVALCDIRLPPMPLIAVLRPVCTLYTWFAILPNI